MLDFAMRHRIETAQYHPNARAPIYRDREYPGGSQHGLKLRRDVRALSDERGTSYFHVVRSDSHAGVLDG